MENKKRKRRLRKKLRVDDYQYLGFDWKRFKKKTEKKWRNACIYSHCSGYQIQPNTRWNRGLSPHEISLFEDKIGFELPIEYKEMLLNLNGFNKDCVDLEGTAGEIAIYDRRCYKYPEDVEKTKWLLGNINEYKEYVHKVLSNNGYNVEEIVGYVPIYGHRAVVVFENKGICPVISVFYDDVIIYGLTIQHYLEHEFCREQDT